MYVFSAFTYIIIVHCQTQFCLLFSIIMNCITYSVLYENLACWISTRLNSPGKTWKLDINGPGKSWKHIKKVLESHGKPLSISVCILTLLFVPYFKALHTTITVFLTYLGSMLSPVCISVILQCFDAFG